jgi:hypothetical protein
MQRLISGVFLVLNVGLLVGFAILAGAPLPGPEPNAAGSANVAFVMLAFGSPLAVYGYWLVHRFLTFVPAEEAAFPRFFLQDMEAPELDRIWQAHSVVLIVLMPAALLTLAWWFFCTRAVALTGGGAVINLWMISELCPLTRPWGTCRLGDTGIAFVPFWHSVIWCGGFSLGALLQIGGAVKRYMQRRRTRPVKRRVALSGRGR